MKPINIQIDQNETTRRYPRRVVWKVAQFVGVAFLGAFLALFCIHRDWTDRMSVAEADAAHYIQKSPRTLLLTSDEYRQPLLHGSSFSLSDGLQWSRYGLTRHIEQGQTVAVTIDRAISPTIMEILTENGYFVTQLGSSTLISQETITLIEGKKGRAWSLNLFNQGRYHDFEEKTSFRLRMSDTFIQFHDQDRARRITSPFGEQDYRALWSSDVLPVGFSPFSVIPADTIEMIIFEDADGGGFRFKFENANLETETLAEIGKQYLLQQQLSTTAWTINDGTSYDELRNDLPISSVINQNSGVIQLLLEQGNRSLRMTQTDEVLILSNRQISLTTEEKSIASSCLPRVRQLFSTELIEAENIKTAHYQPLSSTLLSPWDYSELARRGRVLRLCL
jgi:hypothetical protein